jgi:hypothetical protein
LSNTSSHTCISDFLLGCVLGYLERNSLWKLSSLIFMPTFECT